MPFAMTVIMDDHTECEWGDMASDKAKAQQIFGQAIAISQKISKHLDEKLPSTECTLYVCTFIFLCSSIQLLSLFEFSVKIIPDEISMKNSSKLFH